MKLKRRFLSILLAFSMIVSLFAGQGIVVTESSAAEKNEIVLGELDMQDGYYTYPDVEISLKDESRKLYHLSVSVDSGYMKTSATQIAGVTGNAIVASTGSDVSVAVETLTTEGQYESISFNIPEGATKDQMEEFLKGIHFTTAEKEQMVSVSATGVKDAKMTIEGTEYDLKYFNGHFYGMYNDSNLSWKDAYRKAQNAEFAGVNGYLLTLTSLAEDRFIWGSFGSGGSATKGWMGCTRATTKSGTYGGDGIGDDYWNPLATFDINDVTNNVWRWVCGPEAGQEFGYQSDALGWNGGTSNEGDFVTAEGYFSNWNRNGDEPKEPNGGELPAGNGTNINAEEGYGYYGEASIGNWNDHPDESFHWHATYIEFGAPDESFIEDGEELLIVTETKGSNGTVPVVTPAATDAPATAVPTDAPATVAPTAAPTVKPTAAPVVKQIVGEPAITHEDSELKEGSVLVADTSNVGPEGATYDYQWYIQEPNGTLTPIAGATDATYTIPDVDVNTAGVADKTYVVQVNGTGDYTGTLNSDPLIPITGKPVIKNVSQKDSEGNDVVKVGTVLEADITGVGPEGSHDTLTYQWYYKDGDNLVKVGDESASPLLVLTEDILDKELVVEVYGNGKYYGALESDPYDATRTNADIVVADPDATPEPGVGDDKRFITIKPTKEDTIYAIKDEDGNVLYPETVPAFDNLGYSLTPDADQNEYPGYYAPEPGSVIRFLVDKDKTYDISEITLVSSTDTTVSPSIPSTDIETDYDNNGTPEDNSDDKVTIIIEEPLPNTVYAVLKKDESGAYVEVPVKKDGNGTFVPDSGSTETWSDGSVGTDGTVKFSNLDPGTYKVVAKSDSANQENVKPGDITSGGSGDITPENKPSVAPTATPAPGQGTGGNGGNGGTAIAQPSATPIVIYTPAEEDSAANFIKDYVTDVKGNLITSVTDMTRDLIVSGEGSWNKLTEREKAVVNGKMLASGSQYTYDELLQKAKDYKIPGFKVIKYMQRKTKAKLKLIKCKGATIVCTSTNKKVATVNKKGVIKAKKKGRATLTFTAIKGKYTNRLVIEVRVKKKFDNAKELKNFKSKVIKTPTVLIAKQRVLKKSSRIVVYDLKKDSKVKYTPIKKGILKMTKKGKYTGKKNGKTLVRVNIKQNDKTYLLYVYVTIYQKKKKK